MTEKNLVLKSILSAVTLQLDDHQFGHKARIETDETISWLLHSQFPPKSLH